MTENPTLMKVQKIRESGYKGRWDKTLKSYTHTLDNDENLDALTSLKSIEFVDKDNPDLPYVNSDGGTVLYIMDEYDINEYKNLKKAVAIKATWNDGTVEINPEGVLISGYENDTSLIGHMQEIIVKYTDRGVTKKIVSEASLRQYIDNIRISIKNPTQFGVLLAEDDIEDIVDVRSVLNKYFIIEVHYNTEANPDIWETLDILTCKEEIGIMGWDSANFATEQEVTLKVVVGRNTFTQQVNMIGRYCDSVKIEIKSGNSFVNLNQLDEIDRVNEREVIAKYLTISTHHNVDPEGVYTPVNILTWAEEISINEWNPDYYDTMQQVTIKFVIRGVAHYQIVKMYYSKKILWGTGRIVAVARNSNKVAYSDNGINWTEATLSSIAEWHSVIWGNGRFVAMAQNTNKVAYSDNGINWTQVTLPSVEIWNGVTWGNGRFVTVAANTNKVAYSDNGINWTEATLPSVANWHSVTWGNGRFVTLTLSNSNKVAYSDNGINWTEATLPSVADWHGVTWGNGRFVTVAANSNKAAYSDNGINWTEATLPSVAEWNGWCISQ